MTTVALEEIQKFQLPNLRLTEKEKKKFREAVNDANQNKSNKDTEKTLLKALMLYSGVASRWALAHALPTTLRAAQVISTSDVAWLAFYPYWKKIVEPLMRAEILRQRFVATKAALPESVIARMAEDYAKRLGQYYTTTSGEAMATGFNAYINRRIPARMAAEKVYGAWGLTKRQMTAFIAANLDTKVTSSRRIDPKGRAKRYVARGLKQRLDKLAKQEAYVASQEAEQIIRLHRVKTGEILATAERVWITARDELVCKICGPMDGKRAGVTEHFVLPGGTKVWVAGVHPNCRCSIKLALPREEVRKAELQGHRLHDFNRVHTRDDGGRFSSKPKVKLKEADVSRIMAQLQAETDNSPFNRDLTLSPQINLQKQPSLRPQTGFLKPQTGLKHQSAPSAVERVELKPQAKPNSAKDRTLATQKPQLKPQLKATATQMTEAKIELKHQISAATSTVPTLLHQMEPAKRKMEDTETVLYLDHPIYSVVGDRHPNYGMHGGHGDYGPIRAHIGTESFTSLEEVGAAVENELTKLIDEAIMQHREPLIYMDDFDGNEYIGSVPDYEMVNVIRAVATNDINALESASAIVAFEGRETGVIEEHYVRYSEIADELDLSPEDFTIQVYRTDEVHRSAQVVGGATGPIEAWKIEGDYQAESVETMYEDGQVMMEIIQLTPDQD